MHSLSKRYNSVWQDLKKYWCWSACQVSYNLLPLAQGQISMCTEQKRILLNFPSLVCSGLWPGSISATTGRLLAFTSVRKENGRECLTFFGAQSGKWYVIQMCQGEGKKMRRDGMQRKRTNYSQREGMKTDEAFLIRDILHFWYLETLIHPGYLLWSNNVSINVQKIIINCIRPLKCQPAGGKGCACKISLKWFYIRKSQQQPWVVYALCCHMLNPKITLSKHLHFNT